MQVVNAGFIRTALRSKVFWAVLVLAAIVNVFAAHSASASMATNSRLLYGNASNYCYRADNGPGYFASGMVWLSNNESDYYSEAVTVGTNATSVSVSIRGAVNTCRTVFGGATQMYAINVSTSYLSGLSGNSFYRGTVPGNASFAWSSVGSKLYGNLNVNGVAKCTAASLTTGTAQQTISVAITRQQRQIRPGYDWTSPVIGTEWVPITVTRTCPRYNYNLIPTVTNVTDQGAIETPQPSWGVSGAVRNSGSTVSKPNINWRLTQVVYDRTATIPSAIKNGGTSGSSTLPCTYVTGERQCRDVTTGTRSSYAQNSTVPHSGNAAIDEWPMGTQICFVMSVRQYNQNTDDWRHSPILCYRVGVKPKVDIIGGDLYVGRKPVGMTTAISGRVVTAPTANPSGTYGSWAEYAIASAGPVTSMASGAGFVGGNAPYRALLTFVNSGNAGCGSTSIGCYTQNSTLPDIASRFPTTSSSPTFTGGSLSGSSGTYKGSGNISISGSTISTGRSVIINAPTANVTITGNISYVPATLNSFGQIPQVVIIANNITIAASVTNVDAWLIAPGRVATNGSVSGGVIRTCDVAPASLSATVCEKKLVVNGPVVANKLLMLRTGETGTGANSGNPAEVFNFRPDAYLWALQAAQTSSRVTTVSTTELPPRY